MDKNTKIEIRVSEEMKNKLRIKAQQQNTTISTLIRQIIEQIIEEE